MNAPVSAPKEFNRANEVAYRNYIEGELADTYRKSANVVIPYGFNLGFNGTGGEQVVLSYDGAFKITIDGATVVEIATDAALTALESAYQAADTTLQANITSEATARASADSAEATARSSADATLQTNINTVSASVTTETTARVNGDNALASQITALDAAYQAADTTLQANITSEASTRASADTAIASSVTSLTATVGTNTANISTNATAIATVDGKLSASYGLTVDANGRIASMKLLSNGTTSSVKFTASTFSIYDGTSDVAMFEVSGGSAYVAGSKVRTESMTANAVTSGTVDEDDTAQTFGPTWQAVADVTITTPDANTLVFLPFSAYVESSGDDGPLAQARIKRGSTVIYETDIAGEPPTLDFETPADGPVHFAPTFNGQVSGFDTDAPGAAGSYTYTLEMRSNGAGTSWQASKRRLLALLFKR